MSREFRGAAQRAIGQASAVTATGSRIAREAWAARPRVAGHPTMDVRDARIPDLRYRQPRS